MTSLVVPDDLIGRLPQVMLRELVADMPLLRTRDAHFVATLGMQLQPFFALAGEFITRHGVIGHEVYWVRQGRVELCMAASLTIPADHAMAATSPAIRPAIRPPPSAEDAEPGVSFSTGAKLATARAAALTGSELPIFLSDGEHFGEEVLQTSDNRMLFDARAVHYSHLLYVHKQASHTASDCLRSPPSASKGFTRLSTPTCRYLSLSTSHTRHSWTS